MKLLDRYVFSSFWRMFLASLVVFSISAVSLDFFSRINRFFDTANVEGTFAAEYATLKIIFLFYLAYLPYLLKQVIPFVTVAAALFTLSHMLKANEVFPVLAAGVSVRRLFLPLFICGFLVCIGHLLFQEFVIPSLNREQIALKRYFSGDRDKFLEDLAHLRDGKGTVTRVGRYHFEDQHLEDVIVQRPWNEAGFERWLAERLDPDGESWRAPNGVRVLPAGIGVLPQLLPKHSRVDFGVSPDEVEALASKQGTAEISHSQLANLARKFPHRRHLQVALHKQIARPLTSFVLLLVGIPILLSAGRSLFLGGGLAFGLSVTYYFLDIFFTSLGDRGDIDPFLAAYLPLALFFSIGLARLVTVRT
ncbi:MAG: LptF/LptG family permease [Planctomycetota bacterium]